MVCFKYTPYTNYDIRCGVSRGGAPSQFAPSLSQGALKVFQGVPFFLARIVFATSTISSLQLQVFEVFKS